MILDQLTNMDRYSAIHPGFKNAINFLRSINAETFTSGKMVIKGEQIFALGSAVTGTGIERARLETHRRYIDIQYCVSGRDTIGWKNVTSCVAPVGEYNYEKDVIFFRDIPDHWFYLNPGQCAVFFPEDAHAPLATDETVHKIVVKVLVPG